jgi:hypothetical protein
VNESTVIDSNVKTSSAYSPELRRRADHLLDLSRQIEQTLVLSLPDELEPLAARSRHVELYEAMLNRNLHQLHRAADDLRLTAMRFREHATTLEATSEDAA